LIEPFKSPLYITKPLLPDIYEINEIIKSIWDSNQLTNNAGMVKRLERDLAGFLGADYLSVFSSGTTALEIAYKILRLSGEVITTPFTFAATITSLMWNNLKPVFCDIEEDTLNINPDKIEALITKDTTAIMPVHVFGNPCNAEKIQQIADKYNLSVLYDAAHAFGVKTGGKSVSSFGDVSMLSFHATKVYHTIEGGALVYNKPGLKERADFLRNFGLQDGGNVIEPGINGKLNEVQAAVGILVLKKAEGEIGRRKVLTNLYRELLAEVPGITAGKDLEGVTHNYAYFVIRVDRDIYGLSRDELFDRLREYNVISRKYFYPLCSNFQCCKDILSASRSMLPVANKAAEEVLALPLHGRLTDGDVEKICEIIKYARQKI
jgi:dTDP-4-amino-4,6-dideoxygalactose transaminase